MRVISGSWKGRRLQAPAGDSVRPTTDRVKEAMFNILGPSVNDCIFWDLCCGAGGLGIEALSRGARQVCFVDKSDKSLDAVRGNLAVCGADEARYRLVRAEAASWLTDQPGPSGDESLIVVADPPYQSPAAGAIMGVLEQWVGKPGFNSGIVEYGPRTPDLPVDVDVSGLWTTRRYGESHLAVIRPVSVDR